MHLAQPERDQSRVLALSAVQDALRYNTGTSRAARFWLPGAALLLGLFGWASVAGAHVIIEPADSPAGTTQLYILAVPTEKQSDTVKLEVQFPRNLVVLQLEAPPGWRVTPESDAPGHILGAIWDGGSVPFNQLIELGVLAQNPNSASDLSWSVIQTSADGSEVQWIGPETSQFPAASSRVRASGLGLSFTDYLAGAALLVSLAALVLAFQAWRTVHAGRFQSLPGASDPRTDGPPTLLDAPVAGAAPTTANSAGSASDGV